MAASGNPAASTEEFIVTPVIVDRHQETQGAAALKRHLVDRIAFETPHIAFETQTSEAVLHALSCAGDQQSLSSRNICKKCKRTDAQLTCDDCGCALHASCREPCDVGCGQRLCVECHLGHDYEGCWSWRFDTASARSGSRPGATVADVNDVSVTVLGVAVPKRGVWRGVRNLATVKAFFQDVFWGLVTNATLTRRARHLWESLARLAYDYEKNIFIAITKTWLRNERESRSLEDDRTPWTLPRLDRTLPPLD